MLARLWDWNERFDVWLGRFTLPRFGGLLYEAKERFYWAEDDHRWGTRGTARHAFWLFAFFGRLRDAIRPGYGHKVIYNDTGTYQTIED